MDIIITPQLNSLKLTSSIPASKDWEDKFLLKENQAKILAWCKDNHVRAYWDGVNKKSELMQVVTEANCNNFELLDKLHTEFMQFVGKLQSNKQLSSNENCLEKSKISEKKKFVKSILKNWNETKERMGVIGAMLLGEDSKSGLIYPTFINIDKNLLKQMFEAWLQVYDK